MWMMVTIEDEEFLNYSNEVWSEEKSYLKDTLNMIREQIKASGDEAENYKENIVHEELYSLKLFIRER